MRAPAVGAGGPEGRAAAPKKSAPAGRETQGNGIYLLAHGEPHDPCPVAGCGGTLRFLHW